MASQVLKNSNSEFKISVGNGNIWSSRLVFFIASGGNTMTLIPGLLHISIWLVCHDIRFHRIFGAGISILLAWPIMRERGAVVTSRMGPTPCGVHVASARSAHALTDVSWSEKSSPFSAFVEVKLTKR
jgi:hypothetical protein